LGIHNFSIRDRLGLQKLIRSCKKTKFKIQDVKALKNEKLTQILNVDFDELNKLGIHDFSILINLRSKNKREGVFI
jgi:hypothetical protein